MQCLYVNPPSGLVEGGDTFGANFEAISIDDNKAPAVLNVNINVNVNDSAGAGFDVDVVPPIASTLRISHRVHVKRQLITVSQLVATTKAEPKLQQLHNKELIPIVTGRHRPRAKHCVKIKESHNRANRNE